MEVCVYRRDSCRTSFATRGVLDSEAGFPRNRSDSTISPRGCTFGKKRSLIFMKFGKMVSGSVKNWPGDIAGIIPALVSETLSGIRRERNQFSFNSRYALYSALILV